MTRWVALSSGLDDWVDVRRTIILTEDGLNIHLEHDGDILVLETLTGPDNSWTAVARGQVDWIDNRLTPLLTQSGRVLSTLDDRALIRRLA